MNVLLTYVYVLPRTTGDSNSGFRWYAENAVLVENVVFNCSFEFKDLF